MTLLLQLLYAAILDMNQTYSLPDAGKHRYNTNRYSTDQL